MTTTVEGLLAAGRLEQVEPDVEAARRKLEEAVRHLRSASAIEQTDPQGAYSLLYDAARKAVDASMLANGLRASKSKPGGHHATALYATVVLTGPYAADAKALDRMRRYRNRAEYEAFEVSGRTLETDRRHAARIVEGVTTLLS